MIVNRRSHLKFSGNTVWFHPQSNIYCMPPQILTKFSYTNDSRHHPTNIYPNAETKAVVFEIEASDSRLLRA